ncbi:MAG TPA: hypothetical protein VLJ38_07000, partial [Polyangiaceae bacterium]|nr:hypothetical protein [Polyangiaceae bacterium]
MNERRRGSRLALRSVSVFALAGAMTFAARAGAQGPKPAPATPGPSAATTPGAFAPNAASAAPSANAPSAASVTNGPPGSSTPPGSSIPPDAAAATGAAPPGLDTRGSAFMAYQKALEQRRLAATESLSIQRLRDELARIEDEIAAGRRDEAIGDLVYIVESPRFAPFAQSTEGKTARFLLGDALGRGGAHDVARAYLVGLLQGDPSESAYRRAVHSLVDFGLDSERPRVFLTDLDAVPPSASDEIRGDISYLAGRTAESEGKPNDALTEYAKVSDRSRFWAQATYLTGVIEVEQKRYKEGENAFCKVAEPKLTPKHAAFFGGSDFFRVRDLARLGLGRVAHEQYRFDDARYYYYLVPHDSERLPEALYETATTRYEAKDYRGARDAMDELHRVSTNHPYEDEAWILDSYIDLALCRFPQADHKLNEFLKRYEPVRDAAHKLASDPTAMRSLTESLRTGADPAAAGIGVPDDTARTLGSLLRVDAGYGHATRRLAELDYQMNGLLAAIAELEEANRRLSDPKGLRAQAAGPLGMSNAEQQARVDAQIAELRRLIREAERNNRQADLSALQKELEALEVRARVARDAEQAFARPATNGAAAGADLGVLLVQDESRAADLYTSSQGVRKQVEAEQLALAKDAFERLDRRLTRLLRRARLGRVETVLGKKRALEI